MNESNDLERGGKMGNKKAIKLQEKERKEMEEALQKSQARYKALFDRTLYCVYVHDFEGNFLDANDAALNLLGYTRDEIPRLNFSSIIAEDQLPEAFQGLQEIKQKGPKEKPREFKLRRKDGGYVWVEAEASIIYRHGKPYATQGIARDITNKKQAEELLRESEEKYRTLVENLNAGVYRNTPGPKGKFIEANPAIINMFGYGSKKEFLKLNVSDLYQNSKDREKFNEKILKNGFVRNEELQLKKKDETPIWASVTAIAVYDENGKVKHYDGIIEDIATRKKAEETLRESEEKYRLLVELSQEGICIDDVNDNIVFSNEAFANMLGCKKEDIIGKSLFDFVCEEDKGKLKKESEGRRKGKASKYELRLATKRGGIKTFLISATPLYKNGKYTGSLSMNLEITKRKEAEEEVRRQRKYFQALFSSSPEAIVSLDQKNRVININPAFEKLFGYTLDELKGKNIDDYIVPEQLEKEGRGYTQLVLNGKLVEAESIRALRDGSKRPVSILGAPVFINGDQIGVFGIYRDITERKRAEEEVNRALEEERKFKLETAHYFFNPLAIAKGYLDLMMDEIDEERKNKLKTIHHALGRVESVVKNVVTKGEIHE